MRKGTSLDITYTGTGARVRTDISIETETRVMCYGAKVNIEAVNSEPVIDENLNCSKVNVTDVRFSSSKDEDKRSIGLEIIIAGKEEMLIMAETFENIAAQLREGAK
jgi:hypothetical protein